MKESVVTIQTNYSVLLQIKKDRINYLKARSVTLTKQAAMKCYMEKQFAREKIFHRSLTGLRAVFRYL